jgi:fructokinase
MVAGLVEAAEAALGQRGTLGVGIPGAVSHATGLVKNANTTELIGHPFDRDLSARLGREVRLENDANCFALSESVDGAARDAAMVFGVILGTGVGGAVVVERKVLRGRHCIAGEWGHNPLPLLRDNERHAVVPCYCGRRGCIESFISGPAMVADHLRVTGESTTTQVLFADVSVAAQASVARYIDRLGRALAHVINVLDPDMIVLGGGMGQVGRLYEALPAAIRPHVFSDEWSTPICPPLHGDSSGVRGAAWLWPAVTGEQMWT